MLVSPCSVGPRVTAPMFLRPCYRLYGGKGLLHQETLQPGVQQVAGQWNELPSPEKQCLLENTVEKFPVIKELPAWDYALLCLATLKHTTQF